MGVRIEYFGSGALLGSLHHVQKLRPRSTAVLLCNPFGEEAVRAHRIYRVLAMQLERAGYAALRFDYASTGDSLGPSEDASVERWLADIGAAADWLLQASGATRVVLVGLRLGGSLALLAAARGILRPRHVVLWDPVVDGRAYLHELVTAHHAYMRAELGDAWRPTAVTRADGTPIAALGTPISAALAAELGAIDLATSPPGERMTVITTRMPPELAALRDRWTPPATKWLEMTETAAWNSDAALNAMTVPMNIVQAVVARIEETCP